MVPFAGLDASVHHTGEAFWLVHGTIPVVIPTNANNCRLHSIMSERIGNPELKAAIKCVHEYNFQKFYTLTSSEKEEQ